MATGSDMFALTFRDSPIGMALLDSSGQYVEVNDAFGRILGRKAEHFRGRHFGDSTSVIYLWPVGCEIHPELRIGDAVT